jgi:hypothetical protein
MIWTAPPSVSANRVRSTSWRATSSSNARRSAAASNFPRSR